jgi:cell division protein FtsB
VALLLLLVVLCVGPVRSYLQARTATQHLRTEVAQLQRKHAKLQAELKSASQRTALIAQARKQGYILPGEKPFALTH